MGPNSFRYGRTIFLDNNIQLAYVNYYAVVLFLEMAEYRTANYSGECLAILAVGIILPVLWIDGVEADCARDGVVDGYVGCKALAFEKDCRGFMHQTLAFEKGCGCSIFLAALFAVYVRFFKECPG